VIVIDDRRVPTVEQVIGCCADSGIRRPIDDPDRIARMIAGADLLVTAWDGTVLVGIARSLTDFAYCCYLSDLAVVRSHQRQGVGARLIARTRARIGPECNLVLLAAPEATMYYPRVGFASADHAFLIRRQR